MLSGHRAERRNNLLLGGMKGVEFMRLYVDSKEVPILISALEEFVRMYPNERYKVEKLLSKVYECDKLQVSQHKGK